MTAGRHTHQRPELHRSQTAIGFCFSLSHQLIISGSWDHQIRLWHFDPNANPQPLVHSCVGVLDGHDLWVSWFQMQGESLDAFECRGTRQGSPYVGAWAGGGGSTWRHTMRASHTPPFFWAAVFLHHLKHGVFATWLYVVTQIPTKMAP